MIGGICSLIIICCDRITASYPMGCDLIASTQTCQRSGHNNTYLVYWGSFLTIAILCLCYVGVFSYKVYRSVLQIERKSDTFNFLHHTRFSILDKKAHESREKSSFLKKQGLLYTGALFIVWVFVLQFYVVWLIKGPDYVAYLLLHIFYPAQGFWNCIVYLLPKELRSTKKTSMKNSLRATVIRKHQSLSVEEKVEIGQDVNRIPNQMNEDAPDIDL